MAMTPGWCIAVGHGLRLIQIRIQLPAIETSATDDLEKQIFNTEHTERTEKKYVALLCALGVLCVEYLFIPF